MCFYKIMWYSTNLITKCTENKLSPQQFLFLILKKMYSEKRWNLCVYGRSYGRVSFFYVFLRSSLWLLLVNMDRWWRTNVLLLKTSSLLFSYMYSTCVGRLRTIYSRNVNHVPCDNEKLLETTTTTTDIPTNLRWPAKDYTQN